MFNTYEQQVCREKGDLSDYEENRDYSLPLANMLLRDRFFQLVFLLDI